MQVPGRGVRPHAVGLRARPGPSSAILERFHAPVGDWFRSAFAAPSEVQSRAWTQLLGEDSNRASTLLFAPTGSGKTLAAFLVALDRLMFAPAPGKAGRCRVLYVSPLKALAVDVERNLREPLLGIAEAAASRGVPCLRPSIFVRTGDTPASERARMQRAPPDILITTPESLFLMLTSRARDSLRSLETVIVDEIHSLVPTKRGAHFALSLERLEELCAGPARERRGCSASASPRPSARSTRWRASSAAASCAARSGLRARWRSSTRASSASSS